MLKQDLDTGMDVFELEVFMKKVFGNLQKDSVY